MIILGNTYLWPIAFYPPAPKTKSHAMQGILFLVPEEGLESYRFCTPFGYFVRTSCSKISQKLFKSTPAIKINIIRAPSIHSHDVIFIVPEEGLEPSRLAPHDFESCVYTNSTTPAMHIYYSKNQ